jgi:HPt (histidine-containing phosphotransfer) domain-containing protein
MNKESHPIFDPATLPESFDIDDADILREFYAEFLLQLDELKRVLARTGSATANRGELATSAHRLKSSSQAIGAWQLANCLKMLEQAAVNNTPELQAIFSTTQLLIEPTRTAVNDEIVRLGRGTQP